MCQVSILLKQHGGLEAQVIRKEREGFALVVH